MNTSFFFIDSRVADKDLLISSFSSDVEYCVLDADRDGLDQMVEYLSGRSSYDSIQIISHGSPGSIWLGSTMLNSSTLDAYAFQLSAIGNSLIETGDLLLYGCNVGAGAVGESFVEKLSEMTGADVAASDDVTGGTVVGGDWDLEVVNGKVEADMPLSNAEVQNYAHTLDYTRDYMLAQMSSLAYQDNPSYAGWYVIDDKIESDKTFAAVAFKNNNQNQIVIAFRGTDTKPPLGVDWTGANLAISGLDLDGWDEQFNQAIDFTYNIIKENKDAEILVTGHSLGGGLAQVTSQMFGLNGATYDPGGASNIIASGKYRDKVAELVIKTINDEIDIPLNQSYGSDFKNYLVAGSAVSGWSGGHIGPTETLDYFIYAQEEQLIIKEKTAEASYLLSRLSVDLSFLADGFTSALTTYVFHDMNGILDLMSIKFNEEVTANLMERVQEIVNQAESTGDIGFSSSSYDEGDTEYTSSEFDTNVLANNRDNIIYGHDGNDVIFTYAGNDTIYGYAGNDMISSAQGNDTIESGDGFDTVYGGSGNDRIEMGYPQNDKVYAGAGNDTVIVNPSGAMYGESLIDGGEGDDRVDADFMGSHFALYWSFDEALTWSSYGSGYEEIRAGIESENLIVGQPCVYGCYFNMLKIKAVEHVAIRGGDGNDLLLYFDGERYNGGTGIDTFYADWSVVSNAIVWDNDPESTVTIEGAELSNLERLLIATGSGDDEIRNTRSGTYDYIATGNGNDTIESGEGADTVYGGSGDDHIDIIGRAYYDQVYGGTGNDTIAIKMSDMYGESLIDGGEGEDRVDADFTGSHFALYWSFDDALTWSSGDYEEIRAGIESGKLMVGQRCVYGCDFNMLKIENIEHVAVTGSDGADLLLYLNGDRYNGGIGTDTFYADWSAATAAIVWDNDPAGMATVQGAELSSLEGLLLATGSGDDEIRNTRSATYDYIDTGAGNDTIESGDGFDTVYGGSGNDRIEMGYPQNDKVYGGAGNDTVIVNPSGAMYGESLIDGGEGEDRVDADFTGSHFALYWSFDDVLTWSSGDYEEIRAGIESGKLMVGQRCVYGCDFNMLKIENIEHVAVTGSDGADLLLYLNGDRYNGGIGTDTFYADWLAATAAIVWDNDPTSTVTIQGAEISGLERLLIATGSGYDEIRNTKVNTNDYIDTGAGNDTIEAGEGADTVYGESGDDLIQGGPGTDTAVYRGNYSEYAIGYDDTTEMYTVFDMFYGRDGRDQITSVEYFQFADGTKSVSSAVNDPVAPTLLSQSPADGSIAVNVDHNIVLTFSEVVLAGTGTITVQGEGFEPLVIDIRDTSQVVFDGTKVTIDLATDLANNVSYTLSIDETAIVDLAGNHFSDLDDYEFMTIPEGPAVKGRVNYWHEGAAVSEVLIVMTDSQSEMYETLTGMNSGYQYKDLPEGEYSLTATKEVSVSDLEAIDIEDSLAALDLVLGGTAESPYQYLAADLDQDGRVGFRDTLGILKMAFGREDAPEPEWAIVPADTVNEPRDSSDVNWPEENIAVTLDQDTQIDLVGVLSGDVDGSWGSGK